MSDSRNGTDDDRSRHSDDDDYHALPSDTALRRLEHQQWLNQFAFALETSPKGGPQMTPFRAGAIGRLRLAASYIGLLEHEARQHRLKITALSDEIAILKPAEGR